MGNVDAGTAMYDGTLGTKVVGGHSGGCQFALCNANSGRSQTARTGNRERWSLASVSGLTP